MDVEIDLLGAFALRTGGRVATVRGDYPRAILGRLALSAGEPVAADDLIDDVWPERPDHVLSTLRAHISRLRTSILGDAVIGDRRGYLIDAAEADVDLLALRARQRQLGLLPRSGEQLAGLRELAAGYDRDVLPGLDAHPFVLRLRRAVEDERRTAEEDLGEAALELGDSSLATAILAGTVARHPLHERPVRLLATALARAARTSDAIETVDAYRDRLGGERGLRASARLDRLRASIVRLDPDVVQPVADAVATVRRFGIAIPLTRFVGRDGELVQLRRMARTERLVTLVGPAGVGKTRLAVEAARQATALEVDEQYMVDLADVAAPEEVVAAIATVVRANELTVDAIVRRLQQGRVLLVLDNADRVLGALAIAVDTILARTDDVRVLVTSREPLRLAVERELVVRPLEGDAGGDAWRLFLERAADARGGRPLDPAEEAPARELCAALDGLPLAIELATARLDVLGVAEVRAGVGAWGGASGRHTSVQAAIAWSVDLLDAGDRSALVALARFAGAFSVDAVAGVAEVGDDAARAVLDRLVGKSLVAVVRSQTGRRRYRVLESMREFLGGIDDEADAAAWHERHRRWFAAFAADLAPALRTFEGRDAMAVLDGFRPDLAAALTRSIRAGDRETAVRLAGAQAHHWFLRGLMHEGRRRLDEALAVPGEPDDAGEAGAQLELANLAYQTGDAPGAFAAIATARAQAARTGDASVEVVALSRAGYGRSLFGDAATGAALMAAAEELLADAAPWARSEFHMARGQLLRAQGDGDAALAAVTEANRIAASIGYTWMITSARYVMVKTLVDMRRPREAIAVARSAIAGARAAEDPAGALAVVHVVAGACAYIERHEVGARILGAVDEIGLRYDYSTMTAEGAEAERLRNAIAAGMRPADFDREYRAGRRLGWDELTALLDRLPRAFADSPLLSG